MICEVLNQVEWTLTLDPSASFLGVAREALADRLDGREEAGIEIVDDDGVAFEPYKADEDPKSFNLGDSVHS